MFSSVSSALLWWGVFIGIVSVVCPGITVGAFVILFADMTWGKTALTQKSGFVSRRDRQDTYDAISARP
jgi:hypothetical protein